MKKKYIFIMNIIVGLFLLNGCGKERETQVDNQKSVSKIALILGFGGVDDHSFNQSSWEGLSEWAKETALVEKKDFNYIETNEPQDNSTNINLAVDSGYDTIISLSYLQEEALTAAAKEHPALNFAIIDAQVQGIDNVASITFKDQESAYLAGMAAAYTTQTNKVGFIGGIESTVIKRFESGFKQGVADGAAQLNKEVEVLTQYAGSYDTPDKGKLMASSMYQRNADIIYQAAGSTGNGVFQEARELSKSDKDKKIWVIGVDRDQSDEGMYEAADGKTETVTLASTLKNVGYATADLAESAQNGAFPGGEHLTLGLKELGVDLTTDQLSSEAKQAVKQAKDKICANELVISED